MTFCGSCGKKAQDNHKFCVACGEPITELTVSALEEVGEIVKEEYKANNIDGPIFIIPPTIVVNQLKIFIPVGTAITIVAAVKYALVSISIPTVNI